MRLLKNPLFLNLIIFLFFIADRLMKWLALNKEGFFAIKNFLKIGFYQNWGIALSVPVSQYLIYPLVVIILIVAFYGLYVSYVRKDHFYIWSITLIFVGALSNLIDRIKYGYVVDYLNFNGRFPVFNLADAMIFVGVMMIMFKGFKGNKKISIGNK